MDWGFGNPNKTAALIAILMVAIWALAYFRKWGFWVALGVFIGLGVCLIHTASRGGLVAVAVGSIAVMWQLPRPWAVKKCIAIMIGLWIIIAASIYLETYTRYGQGITQEDPSISNRIELWKSSPRMMVDAPSGWGLGNSGRAYMQWYQPLNRNQEYRTLVNSHLTWLVELGWPMRFLYLFVWFSVLMLCWPMPNRSWLAIPFGIWISFFVSALFSSVAESIWLWVIPVMSLGATLVGRFRFRIWPKPIVWAIPASLAVATLLVLVTLGNLNDNREVTITGSKSYVILGKDSPKLWVLANQRVIGSDYGRTLRRALPPYSIGVASSLAGLAHVDADTLIIGGILTNEEIKGIGPLLPHFQKILFINPSFYPQQIQIDNPAKLVAVFGEFSQSPSIDSWQSYLGKSVSRLAGAGDFIPQWPLLLKFSGQAGTL